MSSSFATPMDCSLPGSSVHGIAQARILEWIAIPFSRDLPNPVIKPRSLALQEDSLQLTHKGSPIAKKGNVKECSNYHTIALISHTSKVMLKIVQARLQQYVNLELPYVQAELIKAEETEIKLPKSIGSSKKQESSRKTSTSVLWTTPNILTVWITTNCGKFFKRQEYQSTLPAS